MITFNFQLTFMKHIILIMFAFVTLNMNAQTSEQKEILKEIEGTYQLDDDFGYSYVRIFENLNATKEEIHAKALSFFPYLVVDTYDAREIIQHENVEEGVIIAKVACNQLASHVSFAHFYIVSATPIIRIDIKDNRARLIISLKKWTVYHKDSSGIFVTEQQNEIPTTNVSPFKLDKKKKINTMYNNAFIKVHNTVMLIFDKFEKSIREGNTSNNESKDDW